MEFDKSKIYTAANADEVKVGSKGYCSDCLSLLKEQVEKSYTPIVLEGVENECIASRFLTQGDVYNLFYLVEEPKEKKFRPYKDTDEMLADYRFKYQTIWANFTMPEIWLKNNVGIKRIISGFYKKGVQINNSTFDLNDLFKYYTYLDGSPCGMEQ